MNLKTFRERQGLTLAEMAERLGVGHPRTVHRYESGRIPRPDVMRRIVEVTRGQVGPADFYALPSSAAAPAPKSEAA